MYLEIKDDGTRKIHPRKPNGFNSDGSSLSNSELIERENTYPVQNEEVTDNYDRLKIKPVEEGEVKSDHAERNYYRVFNNTPDYDPLYQEIDEKSPSKGTQDGDKLYIEGYITDLSVEETKQKMNEELLDLRGKYETGGVSYIEITSGNVLNISTDRDSQSKVVGAYVSANQGVQKNNRKGKTLDGFKELSPNQMKEMGEIVDSFVQECYDNEYRIANLIDGCTSISDCQDVYYNEFNSGWPENAIYGG